MFKWLRSAGGGAPAADRKESRAAPAADRKEDAAALWPQVAAQQLAVVFKHSTSCPVSWMADRRMQAFRAAHPEVPFFKILVREQRELSNELAQRTGVRHESPQLIVFRQGEVVASTSHGEVTEDYLADLIAAE